MVDHRILMDRDPKLPAKLPTQPRSGKQPTNSPANEPNSKEKLSLTGDQLTKCRDTSKGPQRQPNANKRDYEPVAGCPDGNHLNPVNQFDLESGFRKWFKLSCVLHFVMLTDP